MPTPSDWSKVHQQLRAILGDPTGFVRGRPVFGTILQVELFVARYGGRLVSNTPYGPADPDARQVIWKIGDYILVKIKTKGHREGPRAGRAVMSITVTDGGGRAWQNEVYKITGDGVPADLDVIAHKQAVAGRRPAALHELMHPPPHARAQRQVGLPVREARQRRWVEATDMELEAGFNSSGARYIGQIVTDARVRAIGKGVAEEIMTFLTTVVLVRVLTRAQRFDLQRQWEELQPEIDIELQKSAPKALALLRAGKRPYANITFRISTAVTRETGGPDANTETDPRMRLDSVVISENVISTEGPLLREHSGLTITSVKRFTVSYELGI